MGLLYLRCSEKRGNFVGEGARWVGKYVGCDGDGLDSFLLLGEGVGVLFHMIQSAMLLYFEVLQ